MPTRNPGAQVSATPSLAAPTVLSPTVSRTWMFKAGVHAKDRFLGGVKTLSGYATTNAASWWRSPSSPTISICPTNASTKTSITSSEILNDDKRNKFVWADKSAHPTETDYLACVLAWRLRMPRNAPGRCRLAACSYLPADLSTLRRYCDSIFRSEQQRKIFFRCASR